MITSDILKITVAFVIVAVVLFNIAIIKRAKYLSDNGSDSRWWQMAQVAACGFFLAYSQICIVEHRSGLLESDMQLWTSTGSFLGMVLLEYIVKYCRACTRRSSRDRRLQSYEMLSVENDDALNDSYLGEMGTLTEGSDEDEDEDKDGNANEEDENEEEGRASRNRVINTTTNNSNNSTMSIGSSVNTSYMDRSSILYEVDDSSYSLHSNPNKALGVIMLIVVLEGLFKGFTLKFAGENAMNYFHLIFNNVCVSFSLIVFLCASIEKEWTLLLYVALMALAIPCGLLLSFVMDFGYDAVEILLPSLVDASSDEYLLTRDIFYSIYSGVFLYLAVFTNLTEMWKRKHKWIGASAAGLLILVSNLYLDYKRNA